MMIQPKVRGFICTTAHPEGCAEHVREQIRFVKQQPALSNGPKKVLVIGASTGYGLASRIMAGWGAQAATIGVMFEKAADDKRTGTAGWYNTAAFEQDAHRAGLYAKSINGDAFSDAIKTNTIDLIQRDWQGGVDLVVYSLASPRRVHPKTGEIFSSVIKPIGQAYTSKTVDVMTGGVSQVTIAPATEQEIDHTLAVMGGDDWALWMDALLAANVLSPSVITVAYSYIGPELTFPIYRDGTIGRAKNHLEAMAKTLDKTLQQRGGGRALVSVNKALVTQSSAAIPVVPLYISLLYRVMKEHKQHEGCIEQMWRLFHDKLYHAGSIPVDAKGLVRVDDWEMQPAIQSAVAALWADVNTDNILNISDLAGYREEFYRLFGFGLPTVAYDQETDPQRAVPSLQETVA